jgi:hypothetical protein
VRFSLRSYALFGMLIQTMMSIEEFSKRHLLVPYKVHELISARLKIEKREQQSAILDQHTEHRRQRQGRFFARLFRRRPTSKAIDPLGR